LRYAYKFGKALSLGTGDSPTPLCKPVNAAARITSIYTIDFDNPAICNHLLYETVECARPEP